jgi:hypothetical protein
MMMKPRVMVVTWMISFLLVSVLVSGKSINGEEIAVLNPRYFHLVTSVCLSYDSMSYLRALNLFLKSRRYFSTNEVYHQSTEYFNDGKDIPKDFLQWPIVGGFAHTGCIVTVFDDGPNGIFGDIDQSNASTNGRGPFYQLFGDQIKHLVSQSNCSMIRMPYPCTTVDQMALISLQTIKQHSNQVFPGGKVSLQDHFIYMHARAFVYSDPFVHLANLFAEAKELDNKLLQSEQRPEVNEDFTPLLAVHDEKLNWSQYVDQSSGRMVSRPVISSSCQLSFVVLPVAFDQFFSALLKNTNEGEASIAVNGLCELISVLVRYNYHPNQLLRSSLSNLKELPSDLFDGHDLSVSHLQPRLYLSLDVPIEVRYSAIHDDGVVAMEDRPSVVVLTSGTNIDIQLFAYLDEAEAIRLGVDLDSFYIESDDTRFYGARAYEPKTTNITESSSSSSSEVEVVYRINEINQYSCFRMFSMPDALKQKKQMMVDHLETKNLTFLQLFDQIQSLDTVTATALIEEYETFLKQMNRATITPIDKMIERVQSIPIFPLCRMIFGKIIVDEALSYRIPLWMQDPTQFRPNYPPTVIAAFHHYTAERYAKLKEMTRPTYQTVKTPSPSPSDRQGPDQQYYQVDYRTIQLLNNKATNFKLVHPSDCSIILFAIGLDYLVNAYHQARRFHQLNRLGLAYDRCHSNEVNIFLYTNTTVFSRLYHNASSSSTDEMDEDDESLFLIAQTLQQRLNLSDITDYVNAFTAIFLLPTNQDFISFIPSNEIISASMYNMNEDNFHHNALLYWQRISIWFHLPTRYNLLIDSEVYPCSLGYESIFNELGGNTINTNYGSDDIRTSKNDGDGMFDLMTYYETGDDYGGSNQERRFPYPYLVPDRDWMMFGERQGSMYLLDGGQLMIGNRRLQELTYYFAMAYKRQLELMIRGHVVSFPFSLI